MKFNEFIGSKASAVDVYISYLMASSSYMHAAHFITKDYARHKAYNMFFDEMPELVDKFGEQWLGFSGKKFSPQLPDQKSLPSDTIEFIDLLIKMSDEVYSKVPKAIQSTIDEIVGMFYQVKYLLSLG